MFDGLMEVLRIRKPSNIERRLNEIAIRSQIEGDSTSVLERFAPRGNRESREVGYFLSVLKSVSRIFLTLGSDFYATRNGESSFGCALDGVAEVKRLKWAAPMRKEV